MTQMNGEFVKQMGSQRESMLKEINILHEANEKSVSFRENKLILDRLKESLGKTKRVETNTENKKSLFESLETIKKKMEIVNMQSISCLQNVKSKKKYIYSFMNIKKGHLDLDFCLKNHIEEVESYLGLDTIEALRLDTESVLSV